MTPFLELSERAIKKLGLQSTFVGLNVCTTAITSMLICLLKNKAIMSRKKATVTVIAVSIIYAICWVPVLVMYCLAQSLPNQMVHSATHQVTILLAMFNSSVNPVVYSFTSARFRQHLLKLLSGKCYGQESEKHLRPLQQGRVAGEIKKTQEETEASGRGVL